MSVFTHSFLARGFRPFFLLASVYGVTSIFIWGSVYVGYVTPPDIFIDPISWHAHEMIYGFTMSVIAGFLLTAVANWTGGAPARQLHLAGLCLLWLTGRAVMNFSFDLPAGAVFMIESSFIPVLAVSLSVPLIKSWNKRNFVFLVLLGILFACDVAFFIGEDRRPLYVAVMVIVAMISLVGGRIIPAFTVAAIRRQGRQAHQTDQHRLDAVALASVVFVILALLFDGTQSLFLSIFSFASAGIHVWRMRRYHTWKILDDPMVSILHVGYVWLVLGLFFMSLAALDVLPFSVALHALTVGAIGTMTLGMMCRVALGHTGRALTATRGTIVSFVLMQLAIFIRVLGPLTIPDHAVSCIVASAFLWSLSFGLYVVIYTPILLRPRPDGRPA